jgi:hypothetical protein
MYRTCPRCELEMAPGVSCCDCPWRQDGKVIPAIPYGRETYLGAAKNDETCRDCGAPQGGGHHYECIVEQCPHGEQALLCSECPPLANDPFVRTPN